MNRLTFVLATLAVVLFVADFAWGQRRGSGGGDNRGPSPGGGGIGGRGGFDPSEWIKRLDKNGNGSIDPDEAKSNEAFMLRQMAERNPSLDFSRAVKIETINAVMQERAREFDRGRSERGDGDRRDEGRSNDSARSGYGNSNRPATSGKPIDPVVTKDNLKIAYRFGSAWDRLPEGLPEWFRERDENQDGQVLMAEFAKSWTDELAAQFFAYDLNQDGAITARECLDSKDKGAAAVTSIASSERLPTSEASVEDSSSDEGAVAPNAESASTADAPDAASGDLESGGYSKLVITYVADLYKRDDKNGDGAFTKEEWAEQKRNPEVADKNKDGKVTRIEYADWLSGK